MNMDELNEYLDEKYGKDRVVISCDGCRTDIRRSDDYMTKYVDPMWMALCSECAEDAGWN